ncbi:MAG: hypothetical protein OHK93_004503 [Ramalina farinacea]|uniref:Uncharacterized protein n=1 Tax=Ramalina farinacea TaxID=258253 RepID=A0AA43TV41_9LECA|nr:hypothetical protein [Ramalina farinacea]
MDRLSRRSTAVSPMDSSEVSAVASFIDGPDRRQPAKIRTQTSGSSSQVSNLKDLESHSKTQAAGTGLDLKINSTSKLWYKCKDVNRAVCRALGLAIIPYAFRSLRRVTGKGLHEPTKIAIRKSYTIAILRGLIHVLPISFALAEIVLNWNIYYIGVSPYNQAVYQLLAKIHEIMIQASLATVILAYIRHELAFGGGLPLGALVSGLQISQFAYLWSMEFWGTLRSTTYPISRKLKLLIVILTCFTVAILAGPSSAVLLIPRLDFWPAGSTDIWINATPDDIYPSLNGCPSSEWETIQQYLAAFKYYIPAEYDKTYEEVEGPNAITLSGSSSQRLLMSQEDVAHDGRMAPVFSTTPMAAVADALVTTSGLWSLSLANVTAQTGHGAPLSDQSDATQSLSGDSLQGFTAGICVPDLIFNKTDNSPLALPLLYYANDPSLVDSNITYDNFTSPMIMHPSLTRDQILENASNESQYFIQWISTPKEKFNGSSIGAAILLPQSQNPSQEQTLQKVGLNLLIPRFKAQTKQYLK